MIYTTKIMQLSPENEYNVIFFLVQNIVETFHTFARSILNKKNRGL
jgi:hypothetical protein